jgi:acetoin utilization deacetylase AcuC-like enzyme
MKVAVVYHEDFGPKGYSVLRQRIRPSFEKLQESGLIDGEDVQLFSPDPASLELLKAAHTETHIDNVRHDKYYDVALLSAGSVILASELVAMGKAKSAFAYTGTAGHHASPGSCWGFCYFNDVAMSIIRLREMGLKRFLIVDVDPHFGDGTRNFFGEDPDVFHINFSSSTGSKHDPAWNNYDIGLGWAAGNEIFLREFESALELAKDFDFQLCFVIFGHDSHKDDYGGFNLGLGVYPRIALMVRDLVDDRGLVFVLSGGSNPDVASKAIPDIVAVLAGRWPS